MSPSVVFSKWTPQIGMLTHRSSLHVSISPRRRSEPETASIDIPLWVDQEGLRASPHERLWFHITDLFNSPNFPQAHGIKISILDTYPSKPRVGGIPWCSDGFSRIFRANPKDFSRAIGKKRNRKILKTGEKGVWFRETPDVHKICFFFFGYPICPTSPTCWTESQ